MIGLIPWIIAGLAVCVAVLERNARLTAERRYQRLTWWRGVQDARERPYKYLGGALRHPTEADRRKATAD